MNKKLLRRFNSLFKAGYEPNPLAEALTVYARVKKKSFMYLMMSNNYLLSIPVTHRILSIDF